MVTETSSSMKVNFFLMADFFFLVAGLGCGL